MLNAGFQYLEQRDSNDTITKDGVVGKNSPFATSDNSGIYDVIAEDLRWLKENIDDVKDTSDLEAIKQSVTDMYNTMKNDSSFGEATAKAQAEEAKKQAQAALESATNAKTYYDDITNKSTEVNNTIAEIKSYIESAEKLNASNKELETSISDYATVATHKAEETSDNASKAATSASNAATSEANAKTSETNAKTSETNAAKSESDAKAHMDATATSEANAKTSETNAKTSETNSKTSETNAKTSETNAKQYSINSSNSADLSKAWAESSDSPDSLADTDSTTGKTQSSKTWAIYAKDRAISAFTSETNAKTSETNAKTSETNAADSATKAKTSETNAKTSETNAATSASNAATSEANAKTSETNASTSKTNAATSETNAKSYMDTAKEYMEKAQEALAAAQAIQSIIDTAKSNVDKCLADVEAVKESLSKMITYQGSVDNYSDLPTSPQIGYSYNVKNADKTHGVNAGDNLVWNGTDWDNFGGAIDMSLFAELGKDVKFNSVTVGKTEITDGQVIAENFVGHLAGTATSASLDDEANPIATTYETKWDSKTKFNATTSYTNRLQRNKAYSVGDIAYSSKLPSWAYLECITAGTTGTTEPDFSTVATGASSDTSSTSNTSTTGGAIIADGSTNWYMRDARCKNYAGDIVAKVSTPNDYEHLLLCDGSSFDTTKYPELAKIFTDGKVPNLTDGRFLEGNTSAGTLKDAGLPNITGTLGKNYTWSDQVISTGAFSNSYYDSSSGPGDNGRSRAAVYTLDASNSNSIYGNSSTVQPKSYTVVYYVCWGA